MFLLLYIISFLLTYSYSLAYWQRKFPSIERINLDRAVSFMTAIIPFVAIFTLMGISIFENSKKFYGFKFW